MTLFFRLDLSDDSVLKKPEFVFMGEFAGKGVLPIRTMPGDGDGDGDGNGELNSDGDGGAPGLFSDGNVVDIVLGDFDADIFRTGCPGNDC